LSDVKGAIIHKQGCWRGRKGGEGQEGRTGVKQEISILLRSLTWAPSVHRRKYEEGTGVKGRGEVIAAN